MPKAKKDTLSIEHNKLQRDYKNMEETPLEQQKEVEELKMDNANAYQANNDIQRQTNQRPTQMDKKLQR
jgi:hypothetical protein